jgi:hypothetical protein
MYRYNQRQLKFEDFDLPFGGKLRSDNRWVKLAKFIPWDEFEPDYAKAATKSNLGPPAKSVRIALGALIIKERLGTSDEETVEQIRENPYLQYFPGYKGYRDEQPFDPSMFVHFRKRFSKSKLSGLNEMISRKAIEEVKKASENKSSSKNNDDDPGGASGSNRGKLIIDATCTPADITFPTDLKMLNTCREKSEEIIDILHLPLKGKQKKKRTYRKKAGREYLAAARSKKLSNSKRRKALRKQPGYIKRNLRTISQLSTQTPLSVLSVRQYKNLLVIHEVYRQQQWMYDHQENRINDRIVSLSRPHIRPIKRGKAGAATEFGAKSGPPPGRLPAEKDKRREIRLQARQDELDRIPIEGKFGQGKRRFSLSRIMCKLAKTSETAIMAAFIVMNLEKWLNKSILFVLLTQSRPVYFDLQAL